MNSIFIGFSRPKKRFVPFSWLIRWACGSPYSHTYVKFYSESYDRWIIYQASGLKVNFISATLFDIQEVNCGEFQITISDEVKQKTVQWAIDNCGLPYSMRQIFGIALVLLAKSFGKKIKNPWYSDSAYVCSQLVSSILDDLIDKDDEIDTTIATPRDVYDFLIKKGFYAR